MAEQNCRTCIFASWAKTVTGRRMPRASGHCIAEPIIKVPRSRYDYDGKRPYVKDATRAFIWWDSPYSDCEFWAEEQRP
jgi:hypothetical protein